VQLDADHCYWFGGATNELGQHHADRPGSEGRRGRVREGKSTDALLEYCPATDGVFKLQSKIVITVRSRSPCIRARACRPPSRRWGDATAEALMRKEALAARPARSRWAPTTRVRPTRRAGRRRSRRASATGSVGAARPARRRSSGCTSGIPRTSASPTTRATATSSPPATARRRRDVQVPGEGPQRQRPVQGRRLREGVIAAG